MGCVYTPNPSECNDDLNCTSDRCDESVGCVYTPNPAECNDGLDCTLDICDPNQGCLHEPINANCKDADVCTEDCCDITATPPGTGCVYTDVTCPIIDVCSEVTCVSDGDLGCQYSPFNCPDPPVPPEGEPQCLESICDPSEPTTDTGKFNCFINDFPNDFPNFFPIATTAFVIGQSFLIL